MNRVYEVVVGSSAPTHPPLHIHGSRFWLTDTSMNIMDMSMNFSIVWHTQHASDHGHEGEPSELASLAAATAR